STVDTFSDVVVGFLDLSRASGLLGTAIAEEDRAVGNAGKPVCEVLEPLVPLLHFRGRGTQDEDQSARDGNQRALQLSFHRAFRICFANLGLAKLAGLVEASCGKELEESEPAMILHADGERSGGFAVGGTGTNFVIEEANLLVRFTLLTPPSPRDGS